MRADSRLYFLLNVAQQALRNRVDAECLERVGLTSAQTGLLFLVARKEGCMLKDVASGLGLGNAAVSGLLARVEKTGCIRREVSDDDARAAKLYLTSKGQKKLTVIRRLNEELNERLRAGFSEQEVELVLRFLRHVMELGRPPAGDE